MQGVYDGYELIRSNSVVVLYGYGARMHNADAGQNGQILSLAEGPRTSLAISFWIEGGASIFFRFVGTGGYTLGGVNTFWLSGIHHALIYNDGEYNHMWLDGETNGTSVVQSLADKALTMAITGYDNVGTYNYVVRHVDELAIWENPGWTPEEIPGIATALYNGGSGTIWRDGYWR